MTWQNKDWLDQPAHLAVGLVSVYVLCTLSSLLGGYFTIGWLEASTILMTSAFVRELWQHDWDWRRVGTLDLTFFAVGCGIAALFV